MEIFGKKVKTEFDDISDYLYDNSYEFIDVCFLDSFTFIPNDINASISFISCTFPSNFTIGETLSVPSEPNENFIKSVDFVECYFEGILYFNNSQAIDLIDFFDCNINQLEITIESKLPKELNFWGNNVIDSLYISQCTFNSPITMFISRLNYFEIYSIKNNNNFYISIIKGAHIFTIYELINMGTFEIDSVKNPLINGGRFKVLYSKLGDFTVNDCDFTSYETFQFNSNDLSSTQTLDTKWSRKVDDDLECLEFKNSNITYSKNNKNSKVSLDYFTKVRKLLEDAGDNEYQIFNRLYLDKLFKFSGIQDKILIGISKILSNHCSNWFLVLVWFLLLNCLFFNLMSSSLTNASLHYSDISIIINPLHVINHYSFWGKENITINNSFYFLDILLRGLNATLLYHLVKILRRFNN